MPITQVTTDEDKELAPATVAPVDRIQPGFERPRIRRAIRISFTAEEAEERHERWRRGLPLDHDMTGG